MSQIARHALSVDERLSPPELTPGARRIAEVALELFYRHGITATGVDTIAQRSGVTKRTLYDRFGSKDELVRVCLQLRHQGWWAELQEELAAAETTQLRILAVFDAYDRPAADRGCGFINAAGELAPGHHALEVVRADKQAVRQLLGRLIQELEAPAPTPGLADQLFLLLEGSIATRGTVADAHLIDTARATAQVLMASALATAASGRTPPSVSG